MQNVEAEERDQHKQGREIGPVSRDEIVARAHELWEVGNDERCRQYEYDEHRDPPALAVTTLEFTDVGDNVVVVNGIAGVLEELPSPFQMFT